MTDESIRARILARRAAFLAAASIAACEPHESVPPVTGPSTLADVGPATLPDAGQATAATDPIATARPEPCLAPVPRPRDAGALGPRICLDFNP